MSTDPTSNDVVTRLRGRCDDRECPNHGEALAVVDCACVSFLLYAALDELEKLRAAAIRPVETTDEYAYATKQELSNAGATHAKYRMHYEAALKSIAEYDCPGGMPPKHCIGCAACDARKALDGSPEEPTAVTGVQTTSSA
jgi:hypothetical protein